MKKYYLYKLRIFHFFIGNIYPVYAYNIEYKLCSNLSFILRFFKMSQLWIQFIYEYCILKFRWFIIHMSQRPNQHNQKGRLRDNNETF